MLRFATAARLAPLALAAAALGLAGCDAPTGEQDCAVIDLGTLPAVGQSVVDGRPAEANEIFATVALVSGNGSPFCTGTLIAPRVVVTAAHCLDGQNTNDVYIASGMLSAWDANNNNFTATSQLVTHNSYNNFSGGGGDGYGVGNTYDIGIVITSSAVTNVPAAPILSMNDFDNVVGYGANVVITGYGINNLNTGSAGVLYIAQTPFSHRSATEFLAGNPQTPDTCNGDSGGPVYAVVNNQLFLIGATSRAAANASVSCGDGGIYSLVSAFEDWIVDNAGGLYTGSTGGGPVVGDGDGDGDGDVGGQGGCYGACGGQSPDGCWCDDGCAEYGDCCGNIEQACVEDVGGNEPPPAGDWTCPETWIGDGECDCGCGAPDADCTQGTVQECLWNHCEGGEELNPSDPSQCGGTPSGDGDGDGDGDTPVGDGDGDGDTLPTVPGNWTCAPGWYGDGECDCGCGALDSDCADASLDSCVYDGCLEENEVPDPADTTRCIDAGDVEQPEDPSEDPEDPAEDPEQPEAPTETPDDNTGNAPPVTEDDRPDLGSAGPSETGGHLVDDDARSNPSGGGGCDATGGQSKTPMAALALGLLALTRSRRRTRAR